MANNRLNSFDRVFPTKQLFKGKARSSLLWSSLGSIALILLLIDLYLITDLLSTGGQLDLPGELVAEVKALEGSRDDGTIPISVYREDSGIFPSVWWSRNRFFGPALAALYHRVPALRANSSALILLVICAVGLGFFRSMMMSRARRLEHLVSLDAATHLRRSLHRQALRLGPGDLQGTDTAQVLTLFTDETDRLREGVALWVGRLARYPLEILLLTIFALTIHPWVAPQCLIPLAACWYLLYHEKQRNDSTRHRAEARTEAELRLLAESFRKTRIVRGYAMEQFEHTQFRKYLDRFHDKLVSAGEGGRWTYLACRVFVTLCAAIVLYLVGKKTATAPEELSLPAAIILLVTLACLYRPLQALSNLYPDREHAVLAAERIFRYLNRVPEVSQAVGAKFLQPLAKGIRFESVSYQMPNRRKLLNGLDFKIPAGSVVAVVALDPLEARSIAHLLPRFIEPSSGRILFDGEDIAWSTLESLRAETVYVGGTDPFFTGSVLENINCGNKEYTLQKVTEAAKASHAHSFILKFSQGYETVLGEHGEQPDAGQAFRLSLARAILRDPALMIIEEPRAKLDDDTKSLLDDAYGRICRERTVLFLPSRLSTLRRADQIILLHNGSVAAVGTYADLVKKSQLYRHWEYVQFNEFRQTPESTG